MPTPPRYHFVGIDPSLSATGVARLAANSHDEGECRVYDLNRDQDGYGRIGILGVRYRAHRLAWMIDNAREIPEGMVVRHSCDNPPCIRPTHLLLGTALENVHDRDDRGHTVTGESHYSHKLTVDQARDIRRRSQAGESVVRLAREFGIRSWAIQKIRDGKAWKNA